MSKCRACGTNIIWLRTPNGKNMPANEGLVPYKASAEGKQFVVNDWGKMIRCDLEFEGSPTGLARIPHWATCPKSETFRKAHNE